MARSHRKSPPLDSARIEQIALAYVARYATSQARLEAYLRRKLRERGWEGEGEPGLEGLCARFAAAGYIDDAAFARARTGSLLRRGYGSRRVAQALAADGIDAELREELRPGEDERRASALGLARRRGFGPFGDVPPDAALRRKQLAAMVRAGHEFDLARALVDAPDVAAAELWASEAAGVPRCD